MKKSRAIWLFSGLFLILLLYLGWAISPRGFSSSDLEFHKNVGPAEQAVAVDYVAELPRDSQPLTWSRAGERLMNPFDWHRVTIPVAMTDYMDGTSLLSIFLPGRAIALMKMNDDDWIEVDASVVTGGATPIIGRLFESQSTRLARERQSPYETQETE